jgi:phosphosulfolactate synthase
MFTMVNVMPNFLNLPQRTAKPRRRGITHVLDKGLPVAEVAPLLGVCGAYVDVWKLGWGTAYLDPGLTEKLTVLDGHGVLACAGFPCVEVSCGVAQMTAEEKRSLIQAAAERFIVLAEIGAKDPTVEVSAAVWAVDAAADLAAGATWVVTEGRESGTVGLFDPTGEVRSDVVDAVVEVVGIGTTVFEAPRKEQQAWLIRRFGPDVNLANVAPSDALGLEALRLGLRADTFEVAPERLRSR